MVRDRQSTLCRTEKLKGAVLPESTVDAGSGFFFFCEHFFFLHKKKKSEKCFGAELLGSLSDIGGMITGENRGGNQTGYIDASGNYHQRTCFVKGSMISTLEGQKTIESLKLGDKALSWNPETGKLEYRMITNLFERKTDLIYKLTFSSGHSVETTWNHPFWVSSTGTSTGSVSGITGSPTGRWIEAKDLKVGDKSHTANGALVAISSIHTENREETVYNFEVEGNHTYFVGDDGVLVHNQSAGYAIMEAGAVIAPINPVAGGVVVGMGVGVLACASNPNCNKQAEGYITQGVNAVKGFFSDSIDKIKGLWASEGTDGYDDKGRRSGWPERDTSKYGGSYKPGMAPAPKGKIHPESKSWDEVPLGTSASNENKTQKPGSDRKPIKKDEKYKTGKIEPTQHQ